MGATARTASGGDCHSRVNRPDSASRDAVSGVTVTTWVTPMRANSLAEATGGRWPNESPPNTTSWTEDDSRLNTLRVLRFDIRGNQKSGWDTPVAAISSGKLRSVAKRADGGTSRLRTAAASVMAGTAAGSWRASSTPEWWRPGRA